MLSPPSGRRGSGCRGQPGGRVVPPGGGLVPSAPGGPALPEGELGGVRSPAAQSAAGLTGRPHQHTAAHTIIVLEGQLDANGRVIGPGSYAHFPAGEVMRHQAAGDGPCLFVLLFHGPFDVRLAG
jgi:Cupin domain